MSASRVTGDRHLSPYFLAKWQHFILFLVVYSRIIFFLMHSKLNVFVNVFLLNTITQSHIKWYRLWYLINLGDPERALKAGVVPKKTLGAGADGDGGGGVEVVSREGSSIYPHLSGDVVAMTGSDIRLSCHINNTDNKTVTCHISILCDTIL